MLADVVAGVLLAGFVAAVVLAVPLLPEAWRFIRRRASQ